MPGKKFSQNIIAAFNAGSSPAIALFYEAYRPELRLRVNRILGRLTDAEDLVNDIVCKMLKKKPQFGTVRNMENYLGRLTETMCRDYKRSRRTQVIKMDEVQAHYQEIQDREARLAEISSTAQAIHCLAMDMLPPQCLGIFMLAYIQDMRHKEIAERLGISEKTVENQIHIALNKLRREYKRDSGSMDFIKFLLPVLWAHLNSL
ncbi:MAG: sigma-70 family RNA polymerase sigma factor [Bacteroidota bacterium]|nr:sigma-70 family RNA polymerase sigma factor [Bacteroidota bacterium]